MDSIVGWGTPYVGDDDDIGALISGDDDIGALISGDDDDDIGALISGEEIALVGAMRAAGMSNEEIGRKLNRRAKKRAAKKVHNAMKKKESSMQFNKSELITEVTNAVIQKIGKASTGSGQARTVGQQLLSSNQFRITMPLGETASTAAGAAWELSLTLQKPFQPYVLVLDAVFVTSNADAAGVCRVSRIDVGVDNMLAAIGSAPMRAFSALALNNQITYRAASQGATITVGGTVSSVAAQNVVVSGTMYGVGASN